MPRKILVDNIEYEGAILSDDEDRIFDAHFNSLIATSSRRIELLYPDVREVAAAPATAPLTGTSASLARGELDRQPIQEKHVITPNSYLGDLYMAKREHLKAAVMIGKESLAGVFKGIDGRGTELVFSAINAWHILRDQTATETPANAWNNFLATQNAAWASGNNNWLGFGATNSTNANIDKRCMVVIIGYAMLGVNRALQLVQLQVDTITFQPTILHPYMYLAPNQGRVPIVHAKTQVLAPKANYLGTVRADSAQVATIIALGMTIGQGSFMINRYLATVTL
jgi:hypothetical protein